MCLMYFFQVLVKHPDDTPAPYQSVELTVSNYQNNYRVAQNYTSDQNGEVQFTLPAVSRKMAEYSVNVSKKPFRGRKRNLNLK